MIGLSIVIPILNEAQSLEELYDQISTTLRPGPTDYEIIFADDGSQDDTPDKLRLLRRKDPRVKWIRLRSHFGKSAALAAAFKAASGTCVITMDGDLQDDPAEIPKLLARLEEGFDVVSGWKVRRKDAWTRRILSKIYNTITSLVSGVKLHDFNCGLKAYRHEVIKEIQIYGELHRYIPLLAHWRGFRIAEVRVQHRPRKYGKSHYGIGRLLAGFLDLFTVMFLIRFTKKPSRFFGTLGVTLTTVGIVINEYIVYIRVTYGNIQNRYPLLFLGILCTIVGIQLFCTGLLAEMITYGQKRSDREYSIREQAL